MPARRERWTRSERGRRPKASEERTRGGRWAVCRLCGFDEAEAWVGDALAGVVGNGLTIAVGSLFAAAAVDEATWHDRWRSTRLWRRRADSDAATEARFPGRRVVR
jgi:hypothetical protein